MLEDAGTPMAYADGRRAIRASGGLSTQALADLCDVSSRTVEGWEQGRPVPALALYVMAKPV